MFRKVRFVSLTGSILLLFLSSHAANAQGRSGLHTRPLVTGQIDENKRVPLAGNTRPEANLRHDRGALSENFPVDHLLLQLKRPPEQERALQRFIADLHTPGSPDFHKWIAAQEFGERFGVAQSDLDAISAWLVSHGFKVNVVYPSGMLIDFSGTAGQVRKAFQTEL